MEEQVKKQKESFGSKLKGFFASRWNRIKAMKGKDWLNFFINNAVIFMIIIFAVVATIIIKVNSGRNFLALSNIIVIVENASEAMFLALGVGGIIILTGTDLSAGRILGFTAVMAGSLLQRSDTIRKVLPGFGSPWPVFIVIVVVMILGGAFGALNGFFVAKFKLHPFIVTLATSLMIFGLGSMIVTGSTSTTIVYDTVPGLSKLYNASFNIGGTTFHYFILLAILAIVVTWFMWNYTKFGKNMYAVGSNPEAANVSGISVSKTIITVFMFAGILYGFSGFLQASKIGSVYTTTGQNYELNAIAACVIGGVSFTGGIGKIKGVVFGVIIISLLNIGMQQLSFSGNESNVVIGALILFAVTLDMRKYITKR